MTNMRLRYTTISVVLLFAVLTIFPARAGSSYMRVQSSNPARGLVYASGDTCVAPTNDSAYQKTYPADSPDGTLLTANNDVTSCYFNVGSKIGPHPFYVWAKPARGYVFKTWGKVTDIANRPANTDYGYSVSSPSDTVHRINTPEQRALWKGVADTVMGTAGASASIYMTPQAIFVPATAYALTYERPKGGAYSVQYKYLETEPVQRSYTAGTTVKYYSDYQFVTRTTNYAVLPDAAEDLSVESYADDSIRLSADAANFIGWYVNGTKVSTDATFAYEASEDAAIRAAFQTVVWGTPSGDLTMDKEALGTYSGTVYLQYTFIEGAWTATDFALTVTNPSTAVSFGALTLDEANQRLVLPYTYSPTSYGGVSIEASITPVYGAAVPFVLALYTGEATSDEACLLQNGERTHSGSLADMMSLANGLDNKPTVRLLRPVTIAAPLSFLRSMTLDLNSRKLTAQCASAFSMDAAGIEVQILDEGFTKQGEIHTAFASSEAVSIVRFTQAAKLTMQGGTLSAANTGEGSAYGIEVSGGSIFYMTDGRLSVQGAEAQGVRVATKKDYATLNGGSIAVTAGQQAFGVWSAGQSNITAMQLSVRSTEGSSACGAYVKSGVTTVTASAIEVVSATTNAYGVYVKGGRLNMNGGAIEASATSGSYGAYVATGGELMMQQNTEVKVYATGAAGKKAYGIVNGGTADLRHLSVSVLSPTSAAKAVSSLSGAVSTTLNGGRFVAQAQTKAYGIDHVGGTMTIEDAFIQGIASSNTAYGVHTSADADLTNTTIIGEAHKHAQIAYSLMAEGDEAKVSLNQCSLMGSAGSQAYALASSANVTAEGCVLTARTNEGNKAYGFLGSGGTNHLTRCDASVLSYSTHAFGIRHTGGTLTAEGGQWTVEAQQNNASEAQDSQLFGIHTAAGLTTHVTGLTFLVMASDIANSQNVFGAYVEGTLYSTRCAYKVSAKKSAFGVRGSGSSALYMTQNTIHPLAANGSTSYGIYAQGSFVIDGDSVSAEGIATDVYALYWDATSAGEVRSGKFAALSNNTNAFGAINNGGTAGKVLLKGGVYSANNYLTQYAAEGYSVYHIDDTEKAYAEGYRHVIADANPSPYVCRIVGGSRYATLEEAFQYAKDNTNRCTIVLTQSYTLPTGKYELPANASLVIPFNATHTAIMGAKPAMRNTPGIVEEFIRLTLANGAHLNINGKMEVGGEMFCQQTGKTGFINSSYARVQMEQGSRIQLNSGAYLYAWGFITGQGEITVKNNGEVHEMFQIDDMPSMSAIANNYMDNPCKYFPVQRYFIQNIEVPTTYYYNSRLICVMSNYYKGAVGVGYNYDEKIGVVGTSESLFLVDVNDESSWVRKRYDAEHDYQVWDVNSSAKLGSIAITIDDETLHSANYILPITQNMRIHALDGDFTITQSTLFQPGSSLEIDKTASLTVNKTFFDSRNYEQDLCVYVFDKDQWPWTQPYTVSFSPSWANGIVPTREIDDAAFTIHGDVTVKGGLFTSRKAAESTQTDGAHIGSLSSDAGTVLFADSAAADTVLILLPNTTDSLFIGMEPAKLLNADGTYVPTAGTLPDEAFIYANDAWIKTRTEGCLLLSGEQAYAKPSEYAALVSKEPDANHTYHTTAGKTLILMDGCQWWEVEPTADPAVVECKKPGYEGYYYFDTETQAWQHKTVTVTFYASEEGDEVIKTVVTDYNSIPDHAVIASNPAKATTAAATYAFYGWQSSIAPYTVYPWTEPLEKATTDMSYRPVFTETVRHYTVTFRDAANGTDLSYEMAYGARPACSPVKDPTAQYTYYFLYWVAADNETQYAPADVLPAVTESTTYTAVWARITNTYTVEWKDGETVLKTQIKQAYGTATAYDGELPVREADAQYAYTFYGWTDSRTGETYANGATPAVSGNTAYTAYFTPIPRYPVTFANYDGSVLYQAPVTQGEQPAYAGLTPARVRDLDGYYVFTGWMSTSGAFYSPDETLPAVTGKESYTAQYSYTNDLFTVTLNDIDGAGGSWSGRFGLGSTPFYNRDNNDVPVVPAKAATVQYHYTFAGWSPALVPVTADATYTAVFEAHLQTYAVTFANIDGQGGEKVVQVAYGSVPVCPVAPEKTDAVYTYPFTGWDHTPEAVTGTATYTATFSSTGSLRSFPVTFDTDNGDAPRVVNVQYGEMPVWEGEAPVKAQNDAFTYEFAGWDPALKAVTEATTYTAQYTQTLREYIVVFKDYNDTVLKSMQVAYGVIPIITSPVRPLDEENHIYYAFAGWTPNIAAVTGDVTYTAQYDEMVYVASVTDTIGETVYYTTWTDALAAANNSSGSTLRLYEDIVTNNDTISAAMTLDLNGYTMSYTNTTIRETRLLFVMDSLVIEDSRGGGKLYYEGTANSNYHGVLIATDTASLTLKSGTIEVRKTGGTSSSRYAVAVFLSRGSAYILGGELIAISTQTAYAVYDYEEHVTVTGGYFMSEGKSASYTHIFMGSDNIVATGGYFSKDPGQITIPEGYEKKASDIEGYTHQVAPIYVPTGMESIQSSEVRSQKVIEDGQLYILYNGTKYDVQGKKVK